MSRLERVADGGVRPLVNPIDCPLRIAENDGRCHGDVDRHLTALMGIAIRLGMHAVKLRKWRSLDELDASCHDLGDLSRWAVEVERFSGRCQVGDEVVRVGDGEV